MTIAKYNIRLTANQISLQQDAIWRAEGDLRGEQVTCTAGKLWITQENDPKDYIINLGQIFWVTKPGTVVVQAMHEGTFTFSRGNLDSAPSRN